MDPNEPELTDREKVDLLLAVMYDFARDHGVVGFLNHIGFDLRTVRHLSDIVEALPAFYRIRKGRYDVDRLERDLVSWAPVARGISEAAQEARRTGTRPERRVYPDDL